MPLSEDSSAEFMESAASWLWGVVGAPIDPNARGVLVPVVVVIVMVMIVTGLRLRTF
jgi:hypothetical protein